MSKGEDLSSYFPAVIKNISYDSLKVKKLIYIYLLQYAESEPDLSLLSINTFQKDLTDQNPMIRTVALRVLSSLKGMMIITKVPLIVPIVTMSFKKCSVDLSPYVRKAVAISLPKCYRLDDAQLPILLEILETLLNDSSTIVLGPAVSALIQIAPNRLDLLHQHYRKLCSSVKDSDQWNQLELTKVLILYARTYFKAPIKFTEIDPDHLLMLESFKPLLKSRNPMVLVMISDLFFDLDQPILKELSCKSLIRILYSPQQSLELILFSIKDIILKDKHPWKQYISNFYVYPDDSIKVVKLKLEIIDSLCDLENSEWVVSQFESFIYSCNPFLRLATIKIWRDMAIRVPEIAKRTMMILVALLSSTDGIDF
jgi:AP-3 complex subunit beta